MTMTDTPKPADVPPNVPETDISATEREALLRETLQSLQQAFSASDDVDDTGTITKLHQNAAEAVSDLSEDDA